MTNNRRTSNQWKGRGSSHLFPKTEACAQENSKRQQRSRVPPSAPCEESDQKQSTSRAEATMPMAFAAPVQNEPSRAQTLVDHRRDPQNHSTTAADESSRNGLAWGCGLFLCILIVVLLVSLSAFVTLFLTRDENSAVSFTQPQDPPIDNNVSAPTPTFDAFPPTSMPLTESPTGDPSTIPSPHPTLAPTQIPSPQPTVSPTPIPSLAPTVAPTPIPTPGPTTRRSRSSPDQPSDSLFDSSTARPTSLLAGALLILFVIALCVKNNDRSC